VILAGELLKKRLFPVSLIYRDIGLA